MSTFNEAMTGVDVGTAGLMDRDQRVDRHPSIRKAIGDAAWLRLPAAVQARFGDSVNAIEYAGTFDVVHASLSGKLLAQVCRLLGTPVAPFTGTKIPATVRVFANDAGGMVWERTYWFPGDKRCVVSSTKQLDAAGGFVEALPFGLRMPLKVFERDHVLHFVSRGYYFDWRKIRIPLAAWLPPGETHVQHIDEGNDWFRFTMTVKHRWLGEVYFQTGRFKAVDVQR